MRYPRASVTNGPVEKQNGGVNSVDGVVCHSMVGPYSAALGELMKPSRRASWHYSVLKSGDVVSHYHDQAQAWHAGSAYNNSTIGIEHEGGLSPTNEPLTPKQLAASVDLVRWLSKTYGFPLVRKVGLHEHNEVSGEPTACPSKRIPWEFYVQEPIQEDDVKPYLVWDRDRQMVWLIGPKGPTWITTAAEVTKLEADLGKLALVYGKDTINALGRTA